MYGNDYSLPFLESIFKGLSTFNIKIFSMTAFRFCLMQTKTQEQMLLQVEAYDDNNLFISIAPATLKYDRRRV